MKFIYFLQNFLLLHINLLDKEIHAKKIDSLQCIYYKLEVEYKNDILHYENGGDCEYNGEMYSLSGLNQRHLKSGESLLTIRDAEVSEGNIHVSSYNSVQVNKIEKEVRASSSQYEGTKTVFAIRVIAADNAMSSSIEELSNHLFDSSGFNFVTQFSACSFGKLKFQPFQGTTSSGESIGAGVGEVIITNQTKNEDATRIKTEVLHLANMKYGNLEEQFDYVMLCFPPEVELGGSTDWIGYAYVNSWLSVYNDHWCTSPSAQMHEIGHNLGMEHSDPDYSDQSCIMGYSYEELDGPSMCFNGAKSFQLGWYSQGHISISDATLNVGESREMSIVGIVDFEQRGNHASIVEIIDTFDEYLYFIAFNRQSGANSGTKRGGDKVLVTKRLKGDPSVDSFLEAELDTDGKYAIYNSRSKTNTFIWVENINLFADPPVATIQLTKYVDLCYSDEFCDDFNSCTSDSCSFVTTREGLPGAGTCIHTELSCDACGSTFSMEIHTKDHPEQVSWSVLNSDTNIEIAHGSSYTGQNRIYREILCLEFGDFDFEFGFDETSKNPPDYITRMQGNTFHETSNAQVSVSSELSTSKKFAVYCTETECIDYDGCTSDNYDSDTRLCIFEALEECSACKKVEFNITLDNWPEQTSWIISQINGRKIKSAGPYPSLGRRKAPTLQGKRRSTARVLQEYESNYDYEYPYDYWIACLEETLYEFNIYDSFGDGICCYEGMGNYTLHVDDQLKFWGGEFTDRERTGFSLRTCPAGKMLIVIFLHLDQHPEETTIRIYRTGNTAVQRQAGPFPGMEGQMVGISYCIDSVAHNFRIYDSSSNGMCCDFGEGFYVLLVNDVEIRRNGVFTNEQRTYFGARRLFEGSPAETFETFEYNENEIFLEENTDKKGKNELGFNTKAASCSTLQNMPTSSPTESPSLVPSISQAPSFVPSNQPSLSQVPSTMPSDLPSKAHSSSPSFTPSFQDSDEPSSSQFPSEWPSSTPSLMPSGSPTSICDEISDWNMMLHSQSSIKVNEFLLKYCLPKDKSANQFISSIYDETCIKEVNDTSVLVNDTNVVDFTGESFMQGFVSIVVEFASLKQSEFWSNTSDSTGIVNYCVRSELLLGDGSNISVAFVETKVKMNLKFLSDFTTFEIEDIQLEKKDSSISTKQTDSSVIGCVCDLDSACINDPKLVQNSQFMICVTPNDDSFVVEEFVNLSFFQDGVLKFSAVSFGQVNPLTTIKLASETNTAHVISRLTSIFFIETEPKDVFISGSVKLNLKTSRSLQDMNLDRDLLEKSQATFNVKITLRNRRFISARLVFVTSALTFFSLYFIRSKRTLTPSYKLLECDESPFETS